jgi:phage protein D
MPSLDPIIRLAWESSAVRGTARPFDSFLRERVVSWEFTDKASGADTAKLTMDNHDLALLDMEAMRAGNRLHVQWGYPHDMYPTQVVTVEKVKGFRKLTLEGTAEEARRFIGIQRVRTFENATEFDVADEIARSMGFVDARSRMVEQGEIETARRGISQTGETDMEFLIRLAGTVGATFYVSSGVFHFHPRREDRPPLLTFTFWDDEQGTIIGDPEIEHNVQGRPGRVQRRGRSPRERTDVDGTASNQDDRSRPVLGEELPVTDPEGVDWDAVEAELDSQGFEQPALPQSEQPEEREAQSDVSPTTAESDSEATSQARQRFRGAQRQAIKLGITFVGDAGLRADNTIRIEGIGEKYSGNYYLEEAGHSVKPGIWAIKTKLKRNATSRSRGTGRSRRRTVDQGTRSAPAGADLPFTSTFGTWDCQGAPNTDAPPDSDVDQVEDVDAEGETRLRFEPRAGAPRTDVYEPWEEDW